MQYLRKQYMDQLIRKKDNGRIKIITDLRRSGKSCLLFNLYRKYLSIILRKNIRRPWNTMKQPKRYIRNLELRNPRMPLN